MRLNKYNNSKNPENLLLKKKLSPPSKENATENKINSSIEISSNFRPINFKKNKESSIENNQRMRNNLSFISGENISDNKRKLKRSPKIIYNRILQYTPIKKEIKSIKNQSNNENNIFIKNKNLQENNNNLLSNKANLYDSSSTPFLLSKNKFYQIYPNKEINIEINEQNNYTNNNYYNIKYNKINNTDNRYYRGREIGNNQNNNNFYHKIEFTKKPYERSKSPQTSNIIENNRLNDNNDIYNKTTNNFYIPIQMKKSYNYENNIHTNYNRSINKYNNHKEIEIIYSTDNNIENNYKINKNKLLNRTFLQDIDNIESSNIYNNTNYNNNFYYFPDTKNKYSETNIDDNINILFNSDKKKNNLSSDDLDNKESKGYLKKNRSVFINDNNSSSFNNFQLKGNNNQNNNNNNLKEIYDNDIPYKNNQYQEQSFNNKKNKNNANNNKNYNDNGNKQELPIKHMIFKKRPIKEISSLNKELIKNKYKIPQNKGLDIYKNISFSYENENKNNKIIFDNEDNIIEYINKKFEEEKKKTYFNRKLKFTGYILTKKYKGKNLYDIRIEDDIDKINQILKDEKVEVNNELIEINYINNNSNKNKKEENEQKILIQNLENEILNYKKDNELLTKKDNMKNLLIKKLDKEKQNLVEEINKITNENEKMKQLNLTLNEKYLKLKLENIDFTNYKIENAFSFDIIKNYKIKNFDDKKLKEEKIENSNINDNNIIKVNNYINNEINNKGDNNNYFTKNNKPC